MKKLGGTDDGTDEPPKSFPMTGSDAIIVDSIKAIYPYLHGTYGKIKDGIVLFSEPEKDEIERVLLEIDTRENQGEDTLETS